MAEFKEVFDLMMIHEGGWVNDPDDKGLETFRGISRKFWPNWHGWVMIDNAKNYTEFPKNLSRNEDLNELVAEFYKENFWDKWQGDKINNQSIASILVDWLLNSGKWGIIIPQRIMGLVEDGIVGPMTLKAVNTANQKGLFQDIKKAREKFFWDIVKNNPTQQKFIKGWLNRLADFTFAE